VDLVALRNNGSGREKFRDGGGKRVDLLRANGETTPVPPRYGKRFVEVLAWAIDEGHVSARRAALLLETTVDGRRDLFAEHGLTAPFEL
jgi:hypothetical protein